MSNKWVSFDHSKLKLNIFEQKAYLKSIWFNDDESVLPQPTEIKSVEGCL